MQSKQLPALKKDVNRVMEEMESTKVADVMAETDDLIKQIDEWEKKVSNYKDNSKMYGNQAEKLELQNVDQGQIEEMELDFKAKKDLWQTKKAHEVALKKQDGMKFNELDPAAYIKSIEGQVKLLSGARGQMETTMPTGNPVLENLDVELKKYKNLFVVVDCLKQPNLQHWHMDAIKEALSIEAGGDETGSPFDSLDVAKLLAADAVGKKEAIEKIKNGAQKEQDQRILLNNIEKTWNVPGKLHSDETGEVYQLKSSDMGDIFDAMDDTLVKLNDILGSRLDST